MTAKPKKGPEKAKPKPALTHPCPAHLGTDGAALWNRIVGDLVEPWEFDERELALLEEAGRTADELAVLGAALEADGMTVTGSRGQPVLHPAISEIRQLRALLLRLLSTLELSDPLDAVKSATPEQARKRRGAAAKWARESRRLR